MMMRRTIMLATVRRATIGDITDLLPLVDEYWRFDGIAGFDPARVRAQLQRLLPDKRLGGGWIAHVVERPVGYLLGVFVFCLEHPGLTAEIDELFVRPEARGRGIGELLLKTAEAAFMAEGCTNISLQLARDNARGRAFTNRRGYTYRSRYEPLERDWLGTTFGDAAREAPRVIGHEAEPVMIRAGYREDLAYVHDEGYGQMAREAATRLVAELGATGVRSGSVVDLGCASGITARRLVDAGYDAVGIDLSEAMIALARRRVPEAELHVGSFLSIDLPPCVAVTAIGEVFNHGFDPANDARARSDLFRRVYEALVPGGLLLFDVAGPDRARPGCHRTFAEGHDWAFPVHVTFDPGTNVLTRPITAFRRVGTDYRRQTEMRRLTLEDPSDVVDTLKSIDFADECIGSYGLEPLPPGVNAFLARKPVKEETS